MEFRVYRDWDARFRLRKVVLEMWETVDGEKRLLDRSRMRAGLLFAWRLDIKKRWMIRRCIIMKNAMRVAVAL